MSPPVLSYSCSSHLFLYSANSSLARVQISYYFASCAAFMVWTKAWLIFFPTICAMEYVCAFISCSSRLSLKSVAMFSTANTDFITVCWPCCRMRRNASYISSMYCSTDSLLRTDASWDKHGSANSGFRSLHATMAMYKSNFREGELEVFRRRLLSTVRSLTWMLFTLDSVY